MGLQALDPWYVTGLVDGQGSFSYSRSGGRLTLHFGLKRPAEDRPLLDALTDYFGAGRVYVSPGTPAHFRISRNPDLGRVVDHFDAYPLQSSRAALYVIWREMVVLRRAFRAVDTARLDTLADALSQTSHRR